MGLDLFHVVASPEAGNLEYFTLDELGENFLARNKEFITPIKEIDFPVEYLIFPNEFTQSKILDRNESYRNKKIRVGNIKEFEKEIEAESQRRGSKPQYFGMTDNHLSKQLGQSISYETVNFEVVSNITEGIYWKEIGYQRKGMNVKFHEDFGNCELCFDKSSVVKAYEYLQSTSKSDLSNLKEQFERNFIENFVEGKSIFFGSW